MDGRIAQAIYRVRQPHKPSQVDSLEITAREIADAYEKLAAAVRESLPVFERLAGEATLAGASVPSAVGDLIGKLRQLSGE